MQYIALELPITEDSALYGQPIGLAPTSYIAGACGSRSTQAIAHIDSTSCARPAPFEAGKRSKNETRSSLETCSGPKLCSSVLHYLLPWSVLRRLVQPLHQRIASAGDRRANQLFDCRCLLAWTRRTQRSSAMQYERAQRDQRPCKPVERARDARSVPAERSLRSKPR